MKTQDKPGKVVRQVAEQLGVVDASVSPLQRKRPEEPLPSRVQILEAVELVRSSLFPGYFEAEDIGPESALFHVGSALDRAERILTEQVRRASCFFCESAQGCQDCRDRSPATTAAFLKALPGVRDLLVSDVEAAYEGDPAATCRAETLICYPGVMAVTYQRIAHVLYELKVPLIPRIITEHAHSLTGIDIHPGARIGPKFFIDHGTGVVIGETTVIGRNVRLYQGVTLGAKSFPLDAQGNPIKGIKRHPDVEDDVIVYAGATILGTIVIGKGATIGGNVWVTESVPPGGKVLQAHRGGR